MSPITQLFRRKPYATMLAGSIVLGIASGCGFCAIVKRGLNDVHLSKTRPFDEMKNDTRTDLLYIKQT